MATLSIFRDSTLSSPLAIASSAPLTPKIPFITVTTPTSTMLQSTRHDPRHTTPTVVPPSVLDPEPNPNMYGMSLDSRRLLYRANRPEDPTMLRRRHIPLSRNSQQVLLRHRRRRQTEIARLFKDDPDLHADFQIFMPEKSQGLFDEAEKNYLPAPTGRRSRSNTPIDGKPLCRRTDPHPPLKATIPQKSKREVNEWDTISTSPKAPSKATT
ncbi:hypothetical protein DEU56DRAFT_913938 [Suillus clintonianus]|uniref:uncharacterized protein n=1 Tax=Suillus clintonianus TaxID=1904413 RepID=UPI001B8820CF|nr:uncharacterized protein DEU56DRAFT_913938 [Suillus clintonianus]KAG2133328.1 hypothetical protein DEU56DRAFT_913938 [Suillus clintonianus]